MAGPRTFATLTAASAMVGVVGSACHRGDAPEAVRHQDLPPTTIVMARRAGRSHEYPCADCHDKITTGGAAYAKQKHRGLTFAHFNGIENCATCHDTLNRNAFRLLVGEVVSFDDSHLVCGQCHAEKAADLRSGAHGKHIGGWRGVKHRATCVDCHDPHSPAVPKVQALAAPPIPARAIRKGGHE